MLTGMYLGFITIFLIGFVIFSIIVLTTIVKNQGFIIDKINKIEKKIEDLKD